jgi:hypothetical protein
MVINIIATVFIGFSIILDCIRYGARLLDDEHKIAYTLAFLFDLAIFAIILAAIWQ